MKYQNNYPTVFALQQAFPNPFNPETRISFSVPRPSHVTLTLYNVQGQFVGTLYDQQARAGDYTVTWNGTDNPSGTYFIKMTAGDFQQIQKCLLLK